MRENDIKKNTMLKERLQISKIKDIIERKHLKT